MSSPSLKQYENEWNALSWEIEDAIHAFSAMLGWNEWEKTLETHYEDGGEVIRTNFSHAKIVISKALHTHFFIAICRIRENTNSQISLSCLYKKAVKLGLLNDEQLLRAEVLMDTTWDIFKEIKIARGTTVAHLNIPNASAFIILQKKGVTRKNVLQYLNECRELFYLLGESIGKKNHYQKLTLGSGVFRQMHDLHSLLCPKVEELVS